ncbi:MAG: metallophosphoesterase [bacterium]|nr:metallophosphoesterase [bacterium]
MINTQLRILVLSDLHFWYEDELKLISGYKFDVVVLCGDIPIKAIRLIKQLVGDKPVLGIAGNHDEWNTPELGGTENIHGIIKEVNGYRIAGFSGSVRYKNGDYPMFTQEEASHILRNLPKADILISHDGMYKLFGRDAVHRGFKGITRYLMKNRTKLNICGHHHRTEIKRKWGITSICVYRCALITYPDVSLTEIF